LLPKAVNDALERRGAGHQVITMGARQSPSLASAGKRLPGLDAGLQVTQGSPIEVLALLLAPALRVLFIGVAKSQRESLKAGGEAIQVRRIGRAGRHHAHERIISHREFPPIITPA
jgi:hypothetical protein